MIAETFRVHVDPEKCRGHNRCYSIAPGPVASCPEHAISLTEA